MANHDFDPASLKGLAQVSWKPPNFESLVDPQQFDQQLEQIGAARQAEKAEAREATQANLAQLNVIGEALTTIADQGKTESRRTRWLLVIAALALVVAVTGVVVTLVASAHQRSPSEVRTLR